MSDYVLTEDRGRVRIITLNRPEKKNSVPMEMWGNMTDAFEAASADKNVGCVVLTGAGGNFCAGTDLSSFTASDETFNTFPGCQRAVSEFDKPLIAAVDGVAVGAGATIPLHADIVYVGTALRMRFPFVSLGVVPEFGASYQLPANIGAQRAAELMYSAEWIDCQRAVEVGLAVASVDSGKLLETAVQKAEEIAQWPLVSLQATKQLMKQSQLETMRNCMQEEERLMMERAGSPENIEAVVAIMEKRKPDFSQF